MKTSKTNYKHFILLLSTLIIFMTGCSNSNNNINANLPVIDKSDYLSYKSPIEFYKFLAGNRLNGSEYNNFIYETNENHLIYDKKYFNYFIPKDTFSNYEHLKNYCLSKPNYFINTLTDNSEEFNLKMKTINKNLKKEIKKSFECVSNDTKEFSFGVEFIGFTSYEYGKLIGNLRTLEKEYKFLFGTRFFTKKENMIPKEINISSAEYFIMGGQDGNSKGKKVWLNTLAKLKLNKSLNVEQFINNKCSHNISHKDVNYRKAFKQECIKKASLLFISNPKY